MTIARQRFEQVIAGGVRDPSLVRASLDQAESVAKHFEGLIDRYLHNYRSPSIPPQLAAFYADVSRRMILYGLFMHFICFGSNNRVKFKQLDSERLYDLWEERAVRALSKLDAYSKDNQGVPDAVFRELYALDAEPAVRQSGVWWFKRARIETAIRDRFATGIMFGIAVDIATARL